MLRAAVVQSQRRLPLLTFRCAGTHRFVWGAQQQQQHASLHSHAHRQHQHQHTQPPPAKDRSAKLQPQTAPQQPGAAATVLIPSRRGAVSVLRRVRGIVAHYKNGAKLLWKNTKRARVLQKRQQESARLHSNSSVSASAAVSSADSLPLTYPQHVFLQQVRADLGIGIPFIIWLALPIVAYAAPLWALLAPRYVPSTFQTPAQKLAHVRADAFAARSAIGSVRSVYSFHAHACGLEKLRALLERIERGVGRVENLGELKPLARLFATLSPTLMSFPRAHILMIHRTLMHAGFVPRYFYTRSMLVSSLRRWRERIWKEDQLLQSFGVDKLTEAELVEALYARGLYRQPIAMGAVLARQQAERLAAFDPPTSVTAPVVDASHPAKPDDLAHAPTPPTGSTFDPPLLPEPPSAQLLEQWRHVLSEWLTLHAQLHKEHQQALMKYEQPKLDEAADQIARLVEGTHQHTATDKQQQAQTDESTVSSAVAAVGVGQAVAEAGSPSAPAADASPSSSHSAIPTAAPGGAPLFPLVFLAHVGPLARIPSSPADLAAVQDKS